MKVKEDLFNDKDTFTTTIFKIEKTIWLREVNHIDFNTGGFY